jgi:beta-mannosidase
MKQELNGHDWLLTGYKPNEPYFNLTQGKKVGFQFQEHIKSFCAHVPGSIHDDLIRANKIIDPYTGDQAKNAEWVENRDWVYTKRFTCQNYQQYRYHTLVLEGLNHDAIIALNGNIIGIHHNVNTSCKINLNSLLENENELIVIIKQTLREQGQAGGLDTLRHQVQYFGYGWDFSTRLVGIGIHRDVYLLHDNIKLEDIYFVPSIIGIKGKIHFSATVSEETELRFDIWLDENKIHSYEFKVKHNFGVDLWVDNVKRWYPNGEGDPQLYRLEISIYEDQSWVMHSEFNIGFKSIRYLKNVGSKESLPYTIEINDKKLWIKGICITNFDQMVGRVTDEDYHFYVNAMKVMNVNLVRLWGGGIKESHQFYDECDRQGIMVWQDFFQSQSSSKGLASQDSTFMKELSQSAIETIKELRNHVSTVIYCGGNELKDDNMIPLTTLHPNLMMLERLVLNLNPQILFYPTTPSGPNFSYTSDHNHRTNHNIHGPWTFIDGYFDYYNQGDWLFQGEFGVNALSDVMTLNSIIPEEEKRHIQTQDTEFYLSKNSMWWNSSKRDYMFAGVKEFLDLKERVFVSQWIQAESISYAIERNRSRAYASSGNNIWQLNEPWPNVECTSIIDFYKRKKLAFYAIKQAYKPLIIMAKFNDFMWKLNDYISVDVSNFMHDIDADITIELWNETTRLYDFTTHQIIHRGSQHILGMDCHELDYDSDLLFLRVSISSTVYCYTKTYIFMNDKKSWIKIIRKSLMPILDYQDQNLSIQNPYPYTIIYDISKKYRDIIDEPWLILFPYEKRMIHV